MEIQMNEEIARKVLTTVNAGLTSGKGQPIPGQMCVEAAVCYAMGLPHSDEPPCVAPALRSLKISLNDANWSSNEARATGLKRLALAQLGSAGVLDEKEFVRRVVDYAIRISTPLALRAAASAIKDEKHKQALCEAANRCEKEGTRAAAAAAYAAARAARAAAAAYAADAARAAADATRAVAAAARAVAAAVAAARDQALSNYAEDVVQILIDMKAPGCQWLYLTEEAA